MKLQPAVQPQSSYTIARQVRKVAERQKGPHPSGCEPFPRRV